MVTRPQRLDPSPEEPDRSLAILIDGEDVREARSWLGESKHPSRTLGESMSQASSLRLVRKLYDVGAIQVYAIEIDGRADEDQNTGKLVIELPSDHESRTKIFKYCGRLARKLGFDPDVDKGQRYSFVMLY